MWLFVDVSGLISSATSWQEIEGTEEATGTEETQTLCLQKCTTNYESKAWKSSHEVFVVVYYLNNSSSVNLIRGSGVCGSAPTEMHLCQGKLFCPCQTFFMDWTVHCTVDVGVCWRLRDVAVKSILLFLVPPALISGCCQALTNKLSVLSALVISPSHCMGKINLGN